MTFPRIQVCRLVVPTASTTDTLVTMRDPFATTTVDWLTLA
jgi:hypothetical protein